MEEHPKMNGMRNLKTSLLTLLSCSSPDPTTNSKIPNPKSRIFPINQFVFDEKTMKNKQNETKAVVKLVIILV